MKFQFPNTPHDGIPFDTVSENEIRQHQYNMHTMECNFCCETVKVNLWHVVHICEIRPQGQGHTRWSSMYNVSMAENEGEYMVECPKCSMVHDPKVLA